ncbi:hypothetical protein AB0J86_03000 [Micromonospora sp. NPDC049559]|uniref:hypothetical protein n=1 Tax=Micromonospora sp. NPDC049559 TaxID=3155923 RepID=UPI003414FCB9
MFQSVPLSWLFAGMGVWFLFHGLRPASGTVAPRPADRTSHLAHAAMAGVMAAMLWPMG